MLREQSMISGEIDPGKKKEENLEHLSRESSMEIDPAEVLRNRIIVYERLSEKKAAAHEKTVAAEEARGTHGDTINRMKEIHKRDMGEIQDNIKKIQEELDDLDRDKADRRAA